MKKIIALFLTILTLACFTSCGEPSKLIYMQRYGKEVSFEQACEWYDEVSARNQADYNLKWYELDLLLTQEYDYDYESGKSKIEINGTFLNTSDLSKFICKMSFNMEETIKVESDGVISTESATVKMDIVCINNWMYVDATASASSQEGDNNAKYSESVKVKASLANQTLLNEVFTYTTLFSADILNELFQPENAPAEDEYVLFYTSTNYLGVHTSGTDDEMRLTYSQYFEFDENSTLIIESGLREGMRLNDGSEKMTIEATYKICEEVEILEPADKDDYELGEIPDMGFEI